MPSANKLSTPVAVDEELIEGRYAELDGYTVGFESFPQDVDPGPFFAGLPDDRCQCPHWGVVTSGQITFRYADHEETYVAGDAYYAPPGHLPLIAGGTSVTEFSPTAELNATMEVVGANMAAAAGAPA
ncbi:cupin domain-containing protein [Nocardioides marmorisolisilvae]|uniref:Cupin domain-containing protein n=1 Tax=Nocardioides marmorisolisilvae TaxID=1542737 RepID=A0A3N0DT10_9ACTN|nr:cupin domain-containing protein [Nocardioides marmorisolisilvae]RNL78752.1 cupin domain-containing protein [Nocardioides marmorisolisilvae]